MADAPLVVRIAANLDQLRANLLEGVNQIETTSTAMRQMATAYDGSRAISQAGAVMAAIQAVGGVTHLTADEQAKANAVLDAAIQKYAALGQTAPPGMQALADATRAVVAPTEAAGSAWQTFVHGFNIQDAISNPLATAKAAMGAFAESIGPVAVASLAGATAIAAVGAAIYELTARAAGVGGQLQDMYEKTGMSVPALSKLSLAAQVAGSDLDTMARALFMFERNLGEGTAKFQEGLERIGLTMDEVKAAGPDEWLGMIADHLKGIEDPSQRAAAAMELFGRQGREIIPTLMKLDDALKTTNDIQAWTPEQAKEAEQFEMQMKSILIHAEALATGLGRDLMPAVSTLAGWFTTSAPYIKDWLGGVTGVAPAVSNIADAWGLASAAIDMFRGRASDLPKITGDAAKGVEAWRVAALGRVAVPLALTLDEETRIAKGLDDAVKANIATTTKWQAVLDELDDTTFKLAMDHQKQWRDEIAKTLDARNKAVVDGLTETQKAESALADFTAKTSLDTLNYQILKIWQRVDEEEKAFKGSEQQRGQYNAAVEALATAQAQALRDASDSTIIAAAKAADATEASAARQIRAIAGVTKGYWAEVDAAFAAMAAASGGLMSSSGTRVGTPNDGSMERGPGINQGFTVPVNGIGINSQSAIYQIPGRAGGGPVSGGQPYVVGERGAELFIPSSAGTMVPHGGGGAGMVINLSVPISVSTVTPGDARASEQLRQLVEQVVIDTLKNRMHLGNA